MTTNRIILFNYGGGLRGYIPAHIMSRIEEKTGLRMADMVDIFSGPSTGAILSTALNIRSHIDPNRPKYRARHLTRFYEREGAKIFPVDRFRDFRGFIHDFNNRTMKIGQLNKLLRHGHYDPAYLTKCLRDLYGEARLSDTLKSLIIPTFNIEGDQLEAAQDQGENADAPVHTQNSVGYKGGHAVWLKHIKSGRNIKPPQDVKLLDAVLASTAAPSFFPCHHFSARDPESGQTHQYSGIDGSIFDNPFITYHGAISQHIRADENVVMITLGTGITRRTIRKEDWNSYGGLGVVDPVNDLPLINILFQAPETALIDSFKTEMGNNLYEFNKSIIGAMGLASTPSLSIDDGSPENFRRMRLFAEEIMEENARQMDQVCHILVKNYTQKSKRKKALTTQFFNWFKR